MPPEPTDIRLRPGTEDDLDLLREIHHGAMRPHVEATWGVWDEAAQEARFRATTDPLAHEIVEDAGEPVGCQFVRVHADALELVRIYIHPDHQGRGIGTALIRRLCASAASQGKAVRLRVLKTNRAQTLYARLGFLVEDETETHLMMRWAASG
ncbi:MAG: GNAT family N-acetyltransferase [Planctomycetota bacterium]|nr:GNAT family N-acetyltransferase [Planctomycetota bacterium]